MSARVLQGVLGRGARPGDSERVRFAIGGSIALPNRSQRFLVFEDPIDGDVSELHLDFRVPDDYASGGTIAWLWTMFAGPGLAGWRSRSEVAGEGDSANGALGNIVAPGGVVLPASRIWKETTHSIGATLVPGALCNWALGRDSSNGDTHANGLIVSVDSFIFRYDDGA